ncbi:MAG: hypothetical protein A2X08_07695 [Bacteroidetes bacterium GWA2_32_17]|nr:MAG: hypothetical protein A2X08_07695 [Bacteroidetes bacterium GWA2_32_17]
MTGNCKKQCPPNSAFERCVQFYWDSATLKFLTLIKQINTKLITFDEKYFDNYDREKSEEKIEGISNS